MPDAGHRGRALGGWRINWSVERRPSESSGVAAGASAVGVGQGGRWALAAWPCGGAPARLERWVAAAGLGSGGGVRDSGGIGMGLGDWVRASRLRVKPRVSSWAGLVQW